MKRITLLVLIATIFNVLMTALFGIASWFQNDDGMLGCGTLILLGNIAWIMAVSTLEIDK